MASALAQTTMLTSLPLAAAPVQRLCRRASLIRSPVLHQVVRRVQTCQRGPLVVSATTADTASTVRIIVKGRHMDVTPAMREHAQSKVANAIHNFAGIIKEVDVTLTASGKSGKATEAHHQREQAAEVTIYTIRYGVVRAEEVADDCYSAIDLVCDKLKRKLRKVKERALQKSNWPGRGGPKGGETISDLPPNADEEDLPLANAEAAPQPPEIVREKVFVLEPMSVDDALEQIDNVGHDFYIFQDKDSNDEIKIIYKRKAHGYGIIIPAVSQ